MRILVTRPQPAASKTARRLQELGHEALVLPLMQSVADADVARSALRQDYAALALTSAQAAETLASIANDIKDHLDTPVFCVGTATASAARALGFRNIMTGTGTGRSLARMLAASLAATDPRQTLYLAGAPRSPDFEASLRRDGIRFKVVECYRMVPVDGVKTRLQTILAETPPDAVLLYSSETARLFLDLRGAEETPDLRYLCLSPAIARILPSTTGNVAVATTPDEDSLLRLL
ncbi:uroporphyrinogen-III synthase [Pararhizobium antarcticum]|uniref:Uroporphyrinogen-III synthase n=1 Tax=Pararhizobium antarcticum TaxID=1798805 RepID=A0A657LXW9_9HYPH|nr:uroporphyrinogen-III synthase [Pararhizobium antarcticum]OJF89862.1 hypothetical protein AX761_07725 [Rhizobium sp. 58]OJF99811.1 hypothetical protein AX760_12240 [Pararhizobium antarcticum]